MGGKNKVPMAALKLCLEGLGFSNVTTYIQSGNVLLRSDLDAKTAGQKIEAMLSRKFKLDSPSIKVLVLSHEKLQSIIDNKPKGFGEQPEKYYSDAVFLMDIDSAQAMTVFDPREGVDRVWPGDGVIYSERLGSMRVKSRLSKIVGTPMYKNMTIRSWGTTTKLLSMMEEL